MSFTFRSPITVNAGQVPRPQSGFPMLVNYTDARFKSSPTGHVQNASGFDIRPYADAGLTQPLIYELERYNGTTGEVIMHVLRPSIFDGDITYLGYGDAGLSSDGSSAATWSNNFISVYHLKDGTSLNVNDSTGFANATNHSATATTGQIDGAAAFVSASSQFIEATPSGSGGQITISAWVNATSFPNAYNAVFGATAGGVATAFLIKSTGKLAVFFALGGISQGYDGTGTNTLVSATWYYLTMSYNGATVRGYVNASLDGTLAVASQPTTASMTTWDLGKDNLTAGRFWNGIIDEARVSQVARSGDWITTEYNNQVLPSTFATLGTEVAVSPFQGLYTK